MKQHKRSGKRQTKEEEEAEEEKKNDIAGRMYGMHMVSKEFGLNLFSGFGFSKVVLSTCRNELYGM